MIFEVNKNPSPKELRQFGYILVIGFAIIGTLFWVLPWIKSRDSQTLDWSGSGHQLAAILLPMLGLLVCSLTFIAPGLARPVYVVWMTVGIAMGAVMSTILLTVLFVLFLPVFSIIVRRSDPLRRRLEPDSDTYWEDYKPYEPTLERMQRLF